MDKGKRKATKTGQAYVEGTVEASEPVVASPQAEQQAQPGKGAKDLPSGLLKPFDAAASCPMCGSTTVVAKFCQREHGKYLFGIAIKNGQKHMHRVCSRCSFRWLEGVLQPETDKSEEQDVAAC